MKQVKAMNNKKLSGFLIYIICYAISIAFSYSGHYYLSGGILGISAIVRYLQEYQKTGNPISLKGLFSLFWIGGQAISCLKLSRLQKDWSLVTWLCFFLAYTCFCMGYEWWSRDHRKSSFPGSKRSYIRLNRLFYFIGGITLVSVISFCIEAVLLGFIPILSEEPHAYSYFHISGVHYFTVACVLVPALSVIYIICCRKISAVKKIQLFLCNLFSIMIPIACVSRFHLVMMLMLAIVTYMSLRGNLKLSQIITTAVGFLIIVVPVYFFLTVARNHDVEYLNGIFEMKNSRTPIFITQPYMYIANNYDNFNCLVEKLPSYAFGLRMLFPLWAFTGLKFRYPALTDFSIYVTKPELTTVTLFYDAYYDFGIVGILCFGFLCGVICKKLSLLTKEGRNPLIHLFYGQMAIYMVLSFFTTWFSNPATWFWFGITAIVYWFVG